MDAVMSAYLLVLGYTIRIGCENKVEFLRSINEDVKIGRIVLIPEHSGDFLFVTVFNQITQRVDLPILVVSEQVAPRAVIPLPG